MTLLRVKEGETTHIHPGVWFSVPLAGEKSRWLSGLSNKAEKCYTDSNTGSIYLFIFNPVLKQTLLLISYDLLSLICYW